MRIMTPVADEKGLDFEELHRLLSANFDRALDAKYAISNGTLWSAFTHPLAELTDEQFIGCVGQVITLADKMLFNRFDKRRKVLRRAACLAALVCLPTVAVSANETATLLNPIGTNRIIYVCLDGAADDAPLAVSKTYNKIDWNGFSERDLLVFEVKEKMWSMF